MRKPFLPVALAAIVLVSCTKSTITPLAAANTASATGNQVRPTAADSAAARGGNGSGGGSTPAPSSNLDIYTKQLTAGWQVFLGSGESVPGIPGATGTITLLINFKPDNTFTQVATDNITKAQITHNGSWQFSIPANLLINESGLLVLTSGNTTLMSGLLDFIHPGIIQYQPATNNLEPSLAEPVYVFQKA